MALGHRSARSRRSRRATRATATRTTCGRACGPRRRSRGSKRPGYEPFWAITKHADITQISRAAAAVLERARDHARPRRRRRRCSRTEMVVMLDPPRHGPMRRVVNARFTPTRRCEADETTSSASRSTCSTDAVTRRDGGRVRLRRAHRRAAPARGDRLDPRRAERRLGAALPVDQRDHRQGRSRVPARRRDAGPDDEAGPRRAARLLRAPHRAAPRGSARRSRERAPRGTRRRRAAHRRAAARPTAS